MQTKEQIVKYPENLYLKDLVSKSGWSITYLAKKINVSRGTLSDTVHGRYKGTNVVPQLLAELEILSNNLTK